MKGTVLEYSYLPYMVSEKILVWLLMITHFSMWENPSLNDRKFLEEAKKDNPPRVAIPAKKFGLVMVIMVLFLAYALEVTWWQLCLNPFTNAKHYNFKLQKIYDLLTYLLT